MKNFFKSDSLSIGLALFSMFFGAGNVIFPLALGVWSGDQNFFGTLGLVLTAALMPIAGVISMILFKGNYRDFFGRLGKIPGFILALIIISLLGPLGSTPRCIALSYTTLSGAFLDISPILFSGLACILLFFCTFRKNHLLTLLGWVLTPLLLISLVSIILVGLFNHSPVQSIEHTPLHTFIHGLKEGYNTMDLLAAFFFSSTILNLIRIRFKENEEKGQRTAMKASIIGASLLAIIYVGFSTLAALHGKDLISHGKDALLGAITLKIAGPYAGILVCITIGLACLTTAIALLSAFTDFIQKEVFREKISYEATLIGALILTFFVSTFQFAGISAFLGPILEICYPGLILLTFLNIAFHFKNFKPIKMPVFSVFALSTIVYFAKDLII